MLKTWDIFDTLIARRCVFPHIVFQIVERKSNIQGFTQVRMVAEKNVSSHGNYNLINIYEEFKRLTKAPENLCDALKKLECDVELEQSIPITENIRQVKAGDVLISDMYLPEELLRRMLNKAGLLAPVEIVVTSGGKSSGRIWQQLAQNKSFVFHIGDNPESDLKNSRLAGLESALTVLSNPIPVEQYLMSKDFDFGAYLREIRLRNPFAEEIKRTYWQLFTLNIGILILLVQQIDALQKKYGFEYLGFCGRDTHYLRLLYEKYKFDRGEVPTPNDYLYYSRKLVRNSGAEVAKYFSAKINGRKSLMIDLRGTGAHLNNLREMFDLDFSILICIIPSKQSGQKMYPDMSRVENFCSALDDGADVYIDKMSLFLTDTDSKIPDSDAIELLNRSTHNSPLRLANVTLGDKIVPEIFFSAINDTENFDVLEGCLNEVLNSKPAWSSYAVGGGVNNTRFEELLLPVLHVINSSSVSLPLRSQHSLSGRMDIRIFRLLNNVSVQK